MTVIDVTTLIDNGLPGTLRYAVTHAETGHFIYIRKPGLIYLNSDLTLADVVGVKIVGCPEGVGTTIGGRQFSLLKCRDTDISEMRFRWSAGRTVADLDKDSIRSRDYGSRSFVCFSCEDTTIRKCHIGASTDDNMGLAGCKNTTVEDCIISGGFGRQRKALLVGPMSGQPPQQEDWLLKLRHNLIARCDYRMPKIAGGRCLLKGNVIVGNNYGSELDTFSGDIVGNYFCPSPALRTHQFVAAPPSRLAEAGTFVYDNWLRIPNQAIPVKPADEWKALMGDSTGTINWPDKYRRTDAWFDAESLDGENGLMAYAKVMNSAGPTIRDDVDKLAVDWSKDKCENLRQWA